MPSQLQRISRISDKRVLNPESLTHSGGVITAVVNGKAISHTLSGLTANALYYLYLRLVGGTSTLVSLTTAPSATRLLYPDAILVGAFVADGLASPAFGAFASIEGVPTYGTSSFIPTGSWTTGTTYTGTSYRVGEHEVYNVRLNFTANPGGSALTINTRAGRQIETAKLPSLVALDGSSFSLNWGPASLGFVQVASVTAVAPQRFVTSGSTTTYDSYTGTTPATIANGNTMSGTFRIPILGWTNTPLKDL